jgi:putative membrane protein insertion efficiency factor
MLFSAPSEPNFIAPLSLKSSKKPFSKPGDDCKNSDNGFFLIIFRKLAILVIGIYRTLFTAWVGCSCRYYPSCSSYAAEAFSTHPLKSAFKLTIVRILSCRPGGGIGFDPVPKLTTSCGVHQHETQ